MKCGRVRWVAARAKARSTTPAMANRHGNARLATPTLEETGQWARTVCKGDGSGVLVCLKRRPGSSPRRLKQGNPPALVKKRRYAVQPAQHLLLRMDRAYG